MIGMLRYIKKEYSEVPAATIVAAVAAIIYFVSPLDIIPDAIPGIGFADDAAVIAFALNSIRTDIDKYMQWREENGLNDEFHIQ